VFTVKARVGTILVSELASMSRRQAIILSQNEMLYDVAIRAFLDIERESVKFQLTISLELDK
jgi:hypothetical protein